MISDSELEKMMQPIIARQDELNIYVITTIANRIKEIGQLIPSDAHKLVRLLKSGGDVRKINKKIAEITGLNEKDIKNLIKTVAENVYLDAKPFYDYREKSFIALEDNEPLKRAIEAISRQTQETYINLSNSRAFMLRDPENPKKLIPTSLSKTYYTAIDKAVQAVQSGVLSYNTNMRDTLEQLADSGIRTIQYHPESGRRYSQSLEAAVKRNLLDGVRQVNQRVQDITGEQFGSDGKELTVHEMPAPDHEYIQGRQFRNEEYEKLQNNEDFKDVKGREYEKIERPIGHYNCRHFAYSIIVGVSRPNFTDKQLQEVIDRNHKGYTDKNGKHYTKYECSQEMRKLERDIRKAKTGMVTADAAGNEDMKQQYKAELSEARNKYDAFSKECGLKKKILQTEVAGYNKIKK